MHRVLICTILLLFISLSEGATPSRRDASVSDQFSLSDLQSSYSSQVRAAWDLYSCSLVGSIVRSWNSGELDAEDTTLALPADGAVDILIRSGLPISIRELALIKDGQYTHASLGRHIEEQRERAALTAIIGSNNGAVRGGSLLLVGSIALLSDPIAFVVFVLIGIFSKNRKDCIPLSLMGSILFTVGSFSSPSPWGINPPDAVVTMLMFTFSGGLLSVFTHWVKTKTSTSGAEQGENQTKPHLG